MPVSAFANAHSWPVDEINQEKVQDDRKLRCCESAITCPLSNTGSKGGPGDPRA